MKRYTQLSLIRLLNSVHKLFFIIILLLFSFSVQVYGQWVKGIGGTSMEVGDNIFVDGNGNVYIAGSFHDTVDFDPGPGTTNLTSSVNADIFFAKYDSNGDFVWAKSIEGTGYKAVERLVVDGSGNIYLTGHFENTADFDPGIGISNLTSAGNLDMFFSKYDSEGNLIWAKNIGASGEDSGQDIFVNETGYVYITGYFYGTVDFDPGPGTTNLTATHSADIFFAKYDSEGNLIWANCIGGAQTEFGIRIVVDANENIYLSGYFSADLDFDPGPGTNIIISAGLFDVFFAKYNADGNLVWAKSIGGSGLDRLSSMELDESGNIYLVGYYEGTSDFDPGPGTTNYTSEGYDVFFAKYDGWGNLIWANSIGGTSGDFGMSIAIDSNKNVYIAGHFLGTADFDPGPGTNNLLSAGLYDIFLARYDDSGNLMSASRAGGTGNDRVNELAIDENGLVYLTGAFRNTAEFNPGNGIIHLTAVGLEDIFFAKYGEFADLTPPQGYSIETGSIYINGNNAANYSFTITGAEVGATYYYKFKNSTEITDSGIVTSTTQLIQNVDVSFFSEGNITLSVSLKDAAGNMGDTVSVELILDTFPPQILVSSPSLPVTGGEDVTYQITYENADSVFLNSDHIGLQLTGSASADYSIINGNTSNPTITFSNIHGAGKIGFSISPGSSIDEAGNLDWGFEASEKFTINSGPIISHVPDTTIYEDQILELPVSIIDPNGDDIDVMVYSSDDNLLVELLPSYENAIINGILRKNDKYNSTNSYENASLIVVPEANWFGAAFVTIIASDGVFADTSILNIVVLPVNDKPVLSDLPDIEINEDSTAVVYFQGFDVETVALNYWAASSDTSVKIVFNRDSLFAQLIPNPNWFGVAQISIFVSDGELSDTSSFTLTVLAVNDPPVFLGLPEIKIDEGNVIMINLNKLVYDPDDDSTSFSFDVNVYPKNNPTINKRKSNSTEKVSNSNHGFVISIDEHNIATIVPMPNVYGDFYLEVSVFDLSGETVKDTVSLSISPVNDPPVLIVKPVLELMEDEEYAVSIKALKSYIIDPDTEIEDLVIHFTQSENVKIYFNEAKDSLKVTLAKDWFGTDTLHLSVTDNEFFVSSDFFVIVHPVNDLPTIVGLEELYDVCGSDSLYLNLSEMVSDIETPFHQLGIDFWFSNDTLLYNYNNTTGLLKLFTPSNYGGEVEFKISVLDTDDGVTEATSIYKTCIITGIKDLAQAIPNEYLLEQNYPNPFNPTTVIRFGLPFGSKVTLRVFNILGELVATLQDGQLPAGYHEINWNAANIASGIYIYAIVAESTESDKNFVSVKKMLLIK